MTLIPDLSCHSGESRNLSLNTTWGLRVMPAMTNTSVKKIRRDVMPIKHALCSYYVPAVYDVP